MGFAEGFAYGLLGGLFAEVLGLFRLRHQAPGVLPQYLKSPFYWLVTILMMCALVIVYLRSGMLLNPLLAVNVGASAPLIIGTLVAQAPSIPPGKID